MRGGERGGDREEEEHQAELYNNIGRITRSCSMHCELKCAMLALLYCFSPFLYVLHLLHLFIRHLSIYYSMSLRCVKGVIALAEGHFLHTDTTHLYIYFSCARFLTGLTTHAATPYRVRCVRAVIEHSTTPPTSINHISKNRGLLISHGYHMLCCRNGIPTIIRFNE